MKNIVLLVVVFGVVGLVIGYLIFARVPVTGDLIAIGDLFSQASDLVGQIVNDVLAIETIRTNILLTGAGGALLGLVLGVVVNRR
jgi:hypothetical protein